MGALKSMIQAINSKRVWCRDLVYMVSESPAFGKDLTLRYWPMGKFLGIPTRSLLVEEFLGLRFRPGLFDPGKVGITQSSVRTSQGETLRNRSRLLKFEEFEF